MVKNDTNLTRYTGFPYCLCYKQDNVICGKAGVTARHAVFLGDVPSASHD